MIYPVANERRSVVPVAPIFYSPFQQDGNRFSSGTRTKSYPTPYERFVKSAADEIAGFLESAQKLRNTARELVRGRHAESPDPKALTEQDLARTKEDRAFERASKLIGSYNEAVGRLRDAGGYVNSRALTGLASAADVGAYSGIGLSKQADGTLALDEKAYRASLAGNYEGTIKALESRAGLAGKLEKAAARFLEAPASDLVNKNMLALQQFAAYQSTMQSYIQLPTNGLFVNRFI